MVLVLVITQRLYVSIRNYLVTELLIVDNIVASTCNVVFEKEVIFLSNIKILKAWSLLLCILKHTNLCNKGVFLSLFSCNLNVNLVKISTDLLFYACILRILVFDNYQSCQGPLNILQNKKVLSSKLQGEQTEHLALVFILDSLDCHFKPEVVFLSPALEKCSLYDPYSLKITPFSMWFITW